MGASFILASVSPRRKKLLEEVGFEFDVIPSGIHETVQPGESVREHAMRLAREKAREVSERHAGRWVLAADTIVVIDGRVIGKPHNADEARCMLKALSGRTHMVVTGFAVIHKDKGMCCVDAVESEVHFKTIPDDEIEWYVRTNEPYDKAGGYAAQGHAAFFIREVRGSYTNVVGLPLCEVIGVLKRVGAVSFC